MKTRPGESTVRAAPRLQPCAGAVILGLAISIVAASGALAQSRPDVGEMIDDLVTANHILYHQGVLDGFGHVSITRSAQSVAVPHVPRARTGVGRSREHHGIRFRG